MMRVRKLVASARRWLTQPLDEMTRVQRSVRFSADLARYCAKKLNHDRAPQMAAALTYHTLFSLLPTLVLMLVALNVFVGEAQRKEFKQTAVNWVVDALQRNDAPTTPTSPAGSIEPSTVSRQLLIPTTSGETEFGIATETIAESDGHGDTNSDTNIDPHLNANTNPDADVADANRRDFEMVRQRLDEQIQGLLDQLENVKFGSIGVVGVLVFFYGATALLATSERSFNAIFGVRDSRNWLVRLPLYFATIVLAPLLIIATQVFQNRLLDLLDAATWTHWLVGPLAYIAPLAATWLVLWMIYLLLPKTRVSAPAALVGAGVAAIGWGISKELFRLYVGKAAASTLYGALGVLPLFLLWLFLSWLIILFGLEITYTLQVMGAMGRGRRHQLPQTPPWERGQTDSTFDPKWTIPVMAEIGRCFRLGETVASTDIATKLRLPAAVVETLCQTMKSHRLLHRVPCDDEPNGIDGYVLAKSPTDIALTELLALGEKQSMPFDESTPGKSAIESLRRAQNQAMDGQTLDDVI